MSNVKIIFEKEGKVLREPFSFGSFKGEEESEYEIFSIKHNSNFPIKNCGIFIDKLDETYQGSNSSLFDYETLLWMANNYPGYGLSIKQEYEVFGVIAKQASKRLVDTERLEKDDIFSGSFAEILSGPSAGEKREIVGYDAYNSMLLLANDFSGNVEGASYKVRIERENFFKTKSGSSIDHAIPLLYNAGIVPRFETASFSLKLKVPPFFKKSALFYVDVNVKYTPEE